MANIMTLKEFATETKICINTARTRCNSKLYRDNKIARREGRDWRIDFDKYRKVVWGDK